MDRGIRERMPGPGGTAPICTPVSIPTDVPGRPLGRKPCTDPKSHVHFGDEERWPREVKAWWRLHSRYIAELEFELWSLGYKIEAISFDLNKMSPPKDQGPYVGT